MSRISNLTTIRSISPLYQLVSKTNQTSINDFVLKKLLSRILHIKGISISNMSIFNNFRSSLIKLDVFYKTSKISKYRRKTKSLSGAKPIHMRFSDFPLCVKNILTKSCVTNLNSFLTKSNLQESFFLFQRFVSILFIRRQALLIDFVKVTALMLSGKASSMLYLQYMGVVFQYIPKKVHSRFLLFIKILLEFLVSKGVLKGARFEIGGRLLGKQRSSSSKIRIGSLPLHQLSQKITFNKIHVYTLYGAFGLKLWLNKF